MNITDINGVSCVNIHPIKVRFNDSIESNTLGLTIVRDNLRDSALLLWNLMINTNDGWVVSDHGHVELNNQEYIDWGGDNEYPFLFVANKLGLLID